ncbi:MAG: hypothetical protein A2X77_00925 [Gammaproteobacteria bacterium GWE2_42_36]|nr:MAG: hypothetical protein A2X77_00925 [Gammaproteobacteria bacterium GWE2_42_36]
MLNSENNAHVSSQEENFLNEMVKQINNCLNPIESLHFRVKHALTSGSPEEIAKITAEMLLKLGVAGKLDIARANIVGEIADPNTLLTVYQLLKKSGVALDTPLNDIKSAEQTTKAVLDAVRGYNNLNPVSSYVEKAKAVVTIQGEEEKGVRRTPEDLGRRQDLRNE